MRIKFLLFTMLLWGGMISAQDTINYLVITEYRGDNTHNAYLELTNMGEEPVQLNQFEIGHWGGGDVLDYETGTTNRQGVRIPGDIVLEPGETYVFASVDEYGPKKFAQGLEGFSEKLTQDKMWEYADFLVHLPEGLDDGTDIVTPDLYDPFNQQWGPGMNGFFIEQHFPNGDSIVVDQVNGMFTGEDGQNLNRTTGSGYDVAGIPEATGNSILVRRYSVKTGTLNFNEARGVGLDDSEWIPIPIHGTSWRDPMWTVGNHGDYKLDENTLESDVITVDFANKTLTVPFGVQRGDDIMNYFEKKPGVAWEYMLGADADSLTHAAQTGDQLLLYVCGSDLDFAAFDIVVEDPAANANVVVPRTNQDPEGFWREEIESGYWEWPRVTQHESGNDTIWGARGGIPYATRVDSLYDRLDKPANAEWEIVYASGVEKPDLSDGDILKITAQDGSVKEYYISVLPYRANSDSYLTSITWPDIPEFYKGLFGWIGDTIPGFGEQVFNYNVQVPLMVEGIPALVSMKSDPNATVEVTRAKSLGGSVEDRTVNFKVTAEDDTTISNYSVVLTMEKDPNNLQPYYGEPFISEVAHNWWWTGTDFAEIANPGNQPLDLSNYMIAMGPSSNPSDIISIENENNWLYRYDKYIPGYKWAATEGEWIVDPYVAQVDLATNAQVPPGDVFTMGSVNRGECDWPEYPATNQLDVSFTPFESDCYTWENQWNEEIGGGDATPFGKWHTNIIYLFKILNDSIQKGLKPATDPNDFELIDVVGMEDGSLWEVGGEAIGNPFSIRRKPDIYKGNTTVSGAMGDTPEEAEFNVYNLDYYAAQGQGWPWRMRNIISDIGTHFMEPPTQYMSTVGSVVYKVSEGYSLEEEIRGVTTGTIVSDFLENIIKKDEGQTLTVSSSTDGSVLTMGDVLSLNDTLTVISADSTNMSKYVLEVSDEGLSSDAVLTSDKYDIQISQQPTAVGDAENAADSHMGTGTISGFEYGTEVQTVVEGVTVPAGATMSVINENGAYVPMTQLNYDSMYVTTAVNAETYFEVIAEDGTTTITYQLVPQATESSAFVTSNIYSVEQGDLLIKYVPRGTNVQSFLSNLIPSLGASMKVVDKWGYERTKGVVADDDKLVVTSPDETVTTVYYISKLATEFVPESTYLAYILSNAYAIDQVDYKIFGASGTADINEFYSRIEPAAGATAVVVDENGNEKTTGSLARTDMVKVTSADGKIEVMYTFGQLTDAAMVKFNQIEIYPNPTSGRLNVTGVEKGNRIQVFNSVGSAVLDFDVESNHETIELKAHPAGMYLIVVSSKNQLLGKYKAIKY